MLYPVPVKFSESRSRLSQFLEAREAATPQQARTRKVKSATGTDFVQTYLVRGHVISDGAEKTGWALLRLAIQMMHGLRRKPKLGLEDHCISSVYGNIPPLSTNSQELCTALSRGMKVSDRTIRNHIKELQRIGLILKKKFRGTNANYWLWINPLFICELGVQIAPQGPAQSIQKATSATPINTIFPLIEEVLVDLKEIAIGNVEKLVPHEAASETGRFNFREDIGAAEKKKGTGGAAAAPEPRTVGEILSEAAGPEVPPNRTKSVSLEEAKKLTEEFVNKAWPSLYTPHGVTFNEQQTREFKNAVWAGVYGSFPATWPKASVLSYHKEALERLAMAASYYERHPDKYPPMPYAEFEKGKGYFDAGNRLGFANTITWLAARNEKNLRRKIVGRVRLAKREWRRALQGHDPQQRTVLQVFRHHEQRLAELGELALRKFYAAFPALSSSHGAVLAVLD